MKDFPFFTKVNGKFMEVQTMDDLCAMLKKKFEDQQLTNEILRDENKHLKEGIWEKEEVAKLKREHEEMQHLYRKAFIVYDDEWDEIHKWQEEHTKEKHKGVSRRGGAAGCAYEFSFTPTGLGDVGIVKCICGDSFCFRELT